MNAAALSAQLRTGAGAFLADRRRVVGLSLVAAGSMGVVSLYQMGIIDHLPDPPIPAFEADRVDASAEAYAKLMVPDGVLGLCSYAVTTLLAAMGGRDRAMTHPWIPLALAGKVAFDAAQAGKLTVDQWTKHQAFCVWCMIAAGATFASLPRVLVETRAALRQLTGGAGSRDAEA